MNGARIFGTLIFSLVDYGAVIDKTRRISSEVHMIKDEDVLASVEWS